MNQNNENYRNRNHQRKRQKSAKSKGNDKNKAKKNNGELAEILFKNALGELCKKNIISGFYYPRKGGEIDGLGIDFLIYLRSSGLVWCPQIKSGSSDKSSNRLRNRHLKKHPLIRDVFIIKRGEVIENIKRRIIRRINEAIQKTKSL